MPIEAAYAAGFFDGEGCIFIQKPNRGRLVPTLWIAATQVATEPLMWLQVRWGGSVRARRVRNRPTSWRPVSEWYVHGKNAQKFLSDILPFLTVKREQAELALEFQSIPIREGYKDSRMARLQRKCEIADEMRRLNHRHNHRRKGVESHQSIVVQ